MGAGNNLIFSNSRVKALENTLLTEDKITRMAFSDNLEDGIRILYESGYAGGMTIDNINSFESLIEREKEIVTAFFRETMIAGSGMEAFLKEEDYHNAKALMKLKYMHKDVEDGVLAEQGNIEIDELREAIMNDNYDGLPNVMATALLEIDNIFASDKHSPRVIDTILDKAMYKDSLAVAKKGKVKTIIEYFVSKVDLTNILTLLRCKNIDDISLFRENFIEGGSYEYSTLAELFDENLDVIGEKLRYGAYRDIIVSSFEDIKAKGTLVKFEAMIDSYLMKIFRRDKGDIFTVAPLIGFFIAKKIEVKMVRLILVSLKNNVPKETIKERLREFYA